MSDEYIEEIEEQDFNTQFNGRTVWRVIKMTGAHWPLMVGFITMVMAVGAVDQGLTFIHSQMIDEGIIAGDIDRIQELLIVYGSWWLVLAACVFGFITCAGWLGEHIQYDLRKKMFAHLQDLSLSYYDKTPVGWMMSRVTSDSVRVADLVTWGFLDIAWGIANIIAAVYFMMRINVQLALIVIAILPLLVITGVYFKKKILVEYRQVRKINSKITGAYNENITGVRVVKSLRREEGNLNEFGGLTSGMYRASFRAAWLSALFLPVIQLVSALGVALVIGFGGQQYEVGALTIGGIQAFVSYVLFMLWPVEEMSRVYAEMQQAIASAERIFSLLDAEPEIVDGKSAVNPPNLRGDIVFDNVSFAYEPDKPVLTDMNLTIKQGETIALVGPTGAGKSTIVNLIGRFYEPTAGKIHIAGKNYRDWTLHGLQSRIGMVLQTPHLFSGTVMENLKFGRLDASDEEVIAAAKMAGADSFIMELEDGYKTGVGQGGVLLSVGQKQLISIARAILAQPDILIMDEATSSVDTLTEALIQQGMETLQSGRTSFVIAHRLSTIKRADRILVIKDGGISEIGTHAELIRARGHYYNLYTKQFREQKEAISNPYQGLGLAG